MSVVVLDNIGRTNEMKVIVINSVNNKTDGLAPYVNKKHRQLLEQDRDYNIYFFKS